MQGTSREPASSLEFPLPLLYLALALPLIVFLSFFRQPIGVPDEWAHIARAAQIADGTILTQHAVAGQRPQGSIDPAFLALTLAVHKDRRLPLPELMPQLRSAMWTNERVLTDYNSAVYSPLPYLLTSATLFLSRLAGRSIIDTLSLISLVNGVACAFATALAISLVSRGRLAAFGIACLPMTLFEYASASPDGPLIAGSLILAALLARAWQSSQLNLLALIGATILAVVIASTKQPYLPLCGAAIVAMWLAATSRPHWLWLSASLAVSIGLPLLWMAVSNSAVVSITAEPMGAPAEHVAFLLGRPFALLELAFATLQQNGLRYLHELVGYLGWLDAPISSVSAALLWLCLLAALVFDGAANWSRLPSLAFLLAAGIALSFGAVFFGVYVTSSAIGSTLPIEGVQGRYFLPLLPFVVLLVPGWSRLPRLLLPCVALFAASVSVYETVTTVLTRYYT